LISLIQKRECSQIIKGFGERFVDGKPILLLSCPDAPGINARIANFISERRNIIHFDQHVDEEFGRYFTRVE